MVNVKNDCQTHLLGEHLGSAYKLLQFHAHWGPNQAYGSEHKIDGKPTSAEVHFVFWNTRYETVDQAVEKGDGLAVIGVLLK
ncbi:unnamed protein product, partial [Anisakis simplex]|uniref:Alpha-carbonic anhydrase domain-containing protein n=1 Tax=Anisakis simplex TaxID=6269 RepID=A0A0M3JFY2_ANISI